VEVLLVASDLFYLLLFIFKLEAEGEDAALSSH
jgi:hypothetical protein